jgi:hypothetical protein
MLCKVKAVAHVSEPGAFLVDQAYPVAGMNKIFGVQIPNCNDFTEDILNYSKHIDAMEQSLRNEG